jgi:hypothetical protein
MANSSDNNTRPIGKPYRTGGGPKGQAVECLSCHEWFGSKSAYITHLVSNGKGSTRCLTVEEMEQHSNLHLSGGAMWRTGPDPRKFSRAGLDVYDLSKPRKGQHA